MGCVGREQGEEGGGDSGIKRTATTTSSMGGSAEGWLVRLSNRVVDGPSGRPSSSRAGSGLPSSFPTPGERTRRGSSADSPREGGFL